MQQALVLRGKGQFILHRKIKIGGIIGRKGVRTRYGDDLPKLHTIRNYAKRSCEGWKM